MSTAPTPTPARTTAARRAADVYLAAMERHRELVPGARARLLDSIGDDLDAPGAVAKIAGYLETDQGRRFLMPKPPGAAPEHPVMTQARRMGVLAESVDAVFRQHAADLAELDPGDIAAALFRRLHADPAQAAHLRAEHRPEPPRGRAVARRALEAFRPELRRGLDLDALADSLGPEFGLLDDLAARRRVAARIASDPGLQRDPASPPAFDRFRDARLMDDGPDAADDDLAAMLRSRGVGAL